MRFLWGLLLSGGLVGIVALMRGRRRQRDRFNDDLGAVSDQWRAEAESRSGGSDY